jgi:hypothetical protein
LKARDPKLRHSEAEDKPDYRAKYGESGRWMSGQHLNSTTKLSCVQLQKQNRIHLI